MTILVSALIAKLRPILLDPTPGDTWVDADFLRMTSVAQRVICLVKREAYPVRASISMVAGTKQAIPALGHTLIQVYGNTVSGRRVTQAIGELMDVAVAYHPAATQEVDVQQWVGDPRDPTRFDVIPPNTGTGALDALYGSTPPELTAVGDAIVLPDIYEQVIIEIVLSIAYGWSTTRGDTVKEAYHWNRWGALLGITSASQVQIAAQAGMKGSN